MCQKYPKPGAPALVACKPDFDSTIAASADEVHACCLLLAPTVIHAEARDYVFKGRGAMAGVQGAPLSVQSAWSADLFLEVNEFAHSSFPKRILAVSTQLYKSLVCEYKEPEPKKAQCINSKTGQCNLLCYMTELESDSEKDLRYTENNRLNCESSRRHPATVVTIDSGDYPGKACCYKDCDIVNNPNIEKVIPGIKSMVFPQKDPNSWAQQAVMGF